MIWIFKKKPVQEAKPMPVIQHAQPPSKLYNEVMPQQQEMGKQLYKDIKLK